MKAIVAGAASRSTAPLAGTTPPVIIRTQNVSWAALQATNGGPITASNPIDTAISWANTNNGYVRVRLLINGGANVPNWALDLDGPHIVLVTNDKPALSVARWWVAGGAFRNAYDDLQTKLAALYDGVDQVRLVFAAMTMVEYAEPLQRFWNLSTNSTIYTNAGYTIAKDKAAVLDCFQIHAARWPNTVTGFAYNPLDSESSTSYQWAIDDQIATFGTNTQVQNNSMGNCGSLSNNYKNMYHAMQASGACVSFQSATPSNLCSGQTALTAMDTALSYGASCMELIDNYDTSLTPAQLSSYNAAFVANACVNTPPSAGLSGFAVGGRGLGL